MKRGYGIMDTFEMADLIAAREELGERYLEFFTADTRTLEPGAVCIVCRRHGPAAAAYGG